MKKQKKKRARSQKTKIVIFAIIVFLCLGCAVYVKYVSDRNKQDGNQNAGEVGSDTLPEAPNDKEDAADEPSDAQDNADSDKENGTPQEKKSIKILGEELSEYAVVYSVDKISGFSTDGILTFDDIIYDGTGYSLETVSEADADSYERRIKVSYVEEPRSPGFRAFTDGYDLVIECAYANAFERAILRFANDVFIAPFDAGSVSIGEDFLYTDDVENVYYNDFGAVGDGTCDDYMAMYNAHEFASLCGQTVVANAGCTYLVKSMPYGSIKVKTNVKLGDAKIVIEDISAPLYSFESEMRRKEYGYETIKENFGKVFIEREQSNIPWLSELIVGESLVRITNSDKKNYIKYGSDEGLSMSDVFIIDEYGNVSERTPVSFDFTKITKVEIIRLSDEPLSFSGGFVATVSGAVFMNVERANVTVTDVMHLSHTSGGTPAPFIKANLAYNCTFENIELFARTKSDGGVEFEARDSIGLRLSFCQGARDICDGALMSALRFACSKFLSLYDSRVSSVDASLGVFGLTVENSVMGYALSIIGGGELYMENTTVISGGTFINLPGALGASFRGNITLVGCELLAKAPHSRENGEGCKNETLSESSVINLGFDSGAEYSGWDFGYSLHMPKYISVDNFSFATDTRYLIKCAYDKADSLYSSSTVSVFYKNMSIPDISDSASNIFKSIAVSYS